MDEMGVKLNQISPPVSHKSVSAQNCGSWKEDHEVGNRLGRNQNFTRDCINESHRSSKRSPVRGEGVSPNPKRVDRRPSGSSDIIIKSRKRLQGIKPNENRGINLKLSALKELKNVKRIKSPVTDATRTTWDTNDNDDILCDILNELTNNVNISGKKEPVEIDIQQFQTQCLPIYKKHKHYYEAQTHEGEENSKVSEIPDVTNELKKEVDSGILHSDVTDELNQSTPSNPNKPLKDRPKRSIGSDIYDSQIDDVLSVGNDEHVGENEEELGSLEKDFENLLPFR